MNLSSGSTINGFAVLHTGNHNKLQHKEYAIDNNYIVLPQKTDELNNYAKICLIDFDKTKENILIMYDLDIINVTDMNKTTNVKVTFLKENGTIIIKSNNSFHLTGNYRVRSYHVDTGTNIHRIETYVQIDDSSRYIVKCNKYIFIENGDIKNKESEFYFSKSKNLVQAPSSDVVEFTNYSNNKLYNTEVYKFSENANITFNNETKITSETIAEAGTYKISYKNALAKTSNNGIAEIKIYRNDTVMYQQTIRIDNLATNIHDVDTCFECSKNDIIKITVKNLIDETITIVPSRMQLLIERVG